MEFDGYLHYSMTFSATAAADLQDVRLELPFREESAGYMMGAGLLGGAAQGTSLDVGRPVRQFLAGQPKRRDAMPVAGRRITTGRC